MLGGASTGSIRPLPETNEPEIDTYAYVNAVRALNDDRLISLKPLQSRPEGTTFLGASAHLVPARLGNLSATPVSIISDTGSDITLISSKSYLALDPRPRMKKGLRVVLTQVTGESVIQNFIKLNIYFDTPDGPVSMPVEAYIVKNMNAPFILGNDYADQYQISTIRNEQGTFLELGNSGRRVDIPNSVASSHIPIARAQVSQAELDPNSLTNPTVRVKKEVWIPAETVKQVSIDVPFAPEQEEGYIAALEALDSELQLIEAIVSKDFPRILLANPTKAPMLLKGGEAIGRLQHPKKWLDQKDSKNAANIEAKTNAIRALLQNLTNQENQPTMEESTTAELTGGPKTAEVPEIEPIPSERLVQELDFSPSLSPEQRSQLEAVVRRRELAFGLDGRLGHYSKKLEVKLKPGAEPISMRPYSVSPMKREVIDNHLDTWLAAGVIEESNSPWGFPIVIVFRNGKPRFCVDYRKLNEFTIADEYPIPRQTDIIQTLTGSQYLSTFDALSGFTQIELHEDTRPLTAFRSHRGLFQFTRLPFGLKNGPSAFQRIMNDVLAKYLWMFVLVYIDDIVVFSKSFEEHLKHIDLVLGAISNAGLTLAPKKCHLGYQSLLLLGQKVSRLGISTHREKVDAIVALKEPRNVSELQTFLGMMVYFSAYIPFYAWIVSPLFDLLRKKAKWEWLEAHQEAFEISKQVLQSAPILAYAITGNGYRLYTDACDYGLAAILQQIQPMRIADLKGTKTYEKLERAYQKGLDVPNLVLSIPGTNEAPLTIRSWNSEFDETIVDVERVISYWSRVLKPAEKNYSPTEKEALALKEGLIKFQPYLEGEKVQAITDHAALTWSRTFQNINRRLLTWGTVYSAYPDLRIVHRAGRVHSNVDPISRLERRIPFFEAPITDGTQAVELTREDPREMEKDWQERLISKLVQVHAVQSTSVIAEAGTDAEGCLEEEVDLELEGPELAELVLTQELILKYVQGYEKDVYFSKVIETIKSTTDWSNPPLRYYHYSEEGLLYYLDWAERKRVCVPNSLRAEVLTEIHDRLGEAAHAGYERTYNRLSQSYYWPKMAKDTRLFIRTCDICQKIKHRRHTPYGQLRAIPIPAKPFDVVSMDFVIHLPNSQGYTAILVVIDKLTKFGIFIPTRTKIDEVGTARLFLEHVVYRFGLPRQVISDRDTRWRQAFWKEVLNSMGADRNLTTAYHPQADGQTEILNQTLEVALRAYVNADRSNWSQLVPEFGSAYNTTTHTATGFTPSFLLFGYEQNQPSNLISSGQTNPIRSDITKQDTVNFLEAMQTARSRAQDALVISQNAYQNAYNRNHVPVEFEIGDLVLINPHTLRLEGPWGGLGNKLAERYEGPFEVLEKYSPLTYRLRVPPDYDIHPVLNIAHLEPYHSSPEKFGLRSIKERKIRRDTAKEDREVLEILEERYLQIGQDKRRGKSTLHYRCLWRFPDGEVKPTRQWIPSFDMNNAPEVLQAWKLKLRDQPSLKAKPKFEIVRERAKNRVEPARKTTTSKRALRSSTRRN